MSLNFYKKVCIYLEPIWLGKYKYEYLVKETKHSRLNFYKKVETCTIPLGYVAQPYYDWTGPSNTKTDRVSTGVQLSDKQEPRVTVFYDFPPTYPTLIITHFYTVTRYFHPTWLHLQLITTYNFILLGSLTFGVLEYVVLITSHHIVLHHYGKLDTDQ